MQNTEPPKLPALDTQTLLMELLRRAEAMREYIAKRIPAAFRREIASEDVLQEVWMGAFANIASYVPSGPGALDRWLTGILNHKLLDAFKTAARIKRGGPGRDVHRGRIAPKVLHGGLKELPSTRRTPSRECRRREAAQALETALTRLPDDRQAAVRMRYLEGESREKIASRMHKSEAAINSLLFQGLQDLRRWLGSAAQYFTDAG